MSKFLQKYIAIFNYHFNSINKHLILIKRRIFKIIRFTIIEILAIINWYSKITVSNINYLLTSIVLTLTSTLTHFSLYQNSMVISIVLDCQSVWTLTVDISNTICDRDDRDCFSDCSLDLTLIVSFWKIAFLVCCWKQTIISRSWKGKLTCNLAHNIQMDVSVFSVIFNDFCSVLWVLLYLS